MESLGPSRQRQPRIRNLARNLLRTFRKADQSSPDQEASREGLCAFCVSIPWEELAQGTYRDELPRIDEPLETLKASKCRICRLFWRVIQEWGDQWPRTYDPKPPYFLKSLRSDATQFGRISIATRRAKEIPEQDDYTEIIVVSDLAPQSHTKPVEHATLGNIPIDVFRQWITECATLHGEMCMPKSPDLIRGLQVIDCERKTLVKAPPGCQYVALSYVWGESHGYKHDSSDSPLERLPRTVSDSWLLTQKLGYRYLWVDRYCIDQTNTSEKHQQIAQMADVYAAAQLVLVAAGAKYAHGALPLSDKPTRSPEFQESIGHARLICCPRPLSSHITQSSAWASRAWTFQECYFANRRLFCSEKGAIFKCNDPRNDYAEREWYPPVSDSSVDVKTLLELYSQREMTYSSDALAAIIGTLNALRVRHVWGIPVAGTPPHYTLALLWNRIYAYVDHVRRPQFPSWTFLALEDSAEWSLDYDVDTSGISLLESPRSSSKIPWEGLKSFHKDGDAPRYLQITTQTAELALVEAHDHGPRNPKTRPMLAMPVSDDLDVIVYPIRDCVMPEIQVRGNIHGLLFSPEDEDFNERSPVVLLVQEGVECYERVGIFFLGFPPFNSESGILRQGRYLQFRQRSTGNCWEVDCSVSNPYVNFEDRTMPFWQTYNWRSFWAEETIVLG